MKDDFKSFQNRPLSLQIDLVFTKLSSSEHYAFFQGNVAAVYAKSIVASALPLR